MYKLILKNSSKFYFMMNWWFHNFADFYQHLLAGFYYKIGYCHYKLQRLDEAEKNYKQALDINKDLETDTKGKKRNANILNQLGRIKWTKGELNEAVLYYESSLKEKEELYGKYQPEGAITLMLLGLCLDDLGKLDDAIMHYEKCLEIYSSTPFRKEQYKKAGINISHENQNNSEADPENIKTFPNKKIQKANYSEFSLFS